MFSLKIMKFQLKKALTRVTSSPIVFKTSQNLNGGFEFSSIISSLLLAVFISCFIVLISLPISFKTFRVSNGMGSPATPRRRLQTHRLVATTGTSPWSAWLLVALPGLVEVEVAGASPSFPALDAILVMLEKELFYTSV
jgi:hypothetical protein